ncbi:MAG: hypothetical protein JXR20_05765 [Balneola sp.]
MGKKSINRDVTHHGPRLQKLRALIRLLEIHQHNNESIHFYFGIESEGDVVVKELEVENEISYHEEDKNYDPNSNFTINSPEIRKCLVGFMDTWFNKELSDNCYFTFYCTNGYSKDRKSTLVEEYNIDLPDEPILKILEDGDLDRDSIDLISELTVAIYKEEYKKEKSSGFLNEIQEFTPEYWANFFGRISFGFGKPNHDVLKEQALILIQDCKFFNASHSGKEDLILSQILDKLDEVHISNDPTKNLIHISQLENIFLKVTGVESGKQIDMIYKQWDTIEADLSDIRNIKEKMQYASKALSSDLITASTRRASTGLSEKEYFDHIKDFQSLRYRIYELCHDLIRKYNLEDIEVFSDEEFDKLHKYLCEESHKEILELSNDFKYSFTNKRIIDGVIYQLVESCFLSYDKFRK